jgi:D-serine deaminase-like pyridoxal phosphate-dependent protein
MHWSKFELDTPALLLDLDALERNIQRMAAFFDTRPSALRPHCKTHKCVRIAHLQMAAGAIGIACAKVGEAEVMVNGGIGNVLIANQVVGRQKIERLVDLARRASITVAVDHPDNVRALSEAATIAGVKLGVVVEVNVGMNRCGVSPGEEAVALAKFVTQCSGLEFRGVMGYEGHAVLLPTAAERREAAMAAMHLLIDTVNLIQKHGMAVEIVSAGGTGTYEFSGTYPGVTEIQAGSYATMDGRYASIGIDFEQAVSLLCTVISRPRRDMLVIDAGLKAITTEFGLPAVRDVPGAAILKLSEEHGRVHLSDPSRVLLAPGDKIELIPSHGCTTINLHDHYVAYRGEYVEAIWPIEARGKIT